MRFGDERLSLALGARGRLQHGTSLHCTTSCPGYIVFVLVSPSPRELAATATTSVCLGKIRCLIDHAGHEQQGTCEEILAIFGEVLQDGVIKDAFVIGEQGSLLLKIADQAVVKSSLDD